MLDTKNINVTDLVNTLHYNERYTDGTPSLQAIRVQVDEALYAFYRERLALLHKQASALVSVRYAAGDKQRWTYEGNRQVQRWTFTFEEVFDKARHTADTDTTYRGQQAKDALAEYERVTSDLRINQGVQSELKRAYAARPWTRAFLVTDGHVHSSMECSTCFPTTEFSWLTQFSDHNEDEIVEAAGERACTVCYPSAPTLRSFEKASALFTEEEAERNKAREQRKAEKAERAAKKAAKALEIDLRPFGLTGYIARIETLHAAKAYLTNSFQWNQGGAHPYYPADAVQFVAEAVATKVGTTPEIELAAAQKRAKNRK